MSEDNCLICQKFWNRSGNYLHSCKIYWDQINYLGSLKQMVKLMQFQPCRKIKKFDVKLVELVMSCVGVWIKTFFSIFWKKNFVKPHKISSNSTHSNNFYFQSDWFEILWSFMKFFFKQMLKILAFYLEKQKSFILKNI